jgi:hypothetical protein
MRYRFVSLLPASGVMREDIARLVGTAVTEASLPHAHQAVMEQGATAPTGSSLRQAESIVTQLVTHNSTRGGAQVGLTGSDLLQRPSGRQDSNLRPLDPQDVGVGISPGQTGCRRRVHE